MKNKQRRTMLKIFKLQLWITMTFFLAYIISIGLGERGVFSSDLDNKKRVAGTAVSAMLRIFGPPEKPNVSGNASCGNEGFSIVNLRWNNVVDATTYDVYRNGEEIVSGLIDNFIVEENLASETLYKYYVVARGPAGSTTSDTKEFLTKKCRAPRTPFAGISTFEGIGLSQRNGPLITTNKKPLFQGQTSMPLAAVELEVHSNMVIYGTTQTNAEGYWQWSPLVNISRGPHRLSAKVIDLEDPTLVANTFLEFEIIEEAEIKIKEDEKNVEVIAGGSSQKNEPIEVPQERKNQKPFELDISIENKTVISGVKIAEEVYREEDLKATIEFNGMAKAGLPVDVSYALIDSDEKIVGQYYHQAFLNRGSRVEEIIPLPLDLKLGKYKLRVSATIGSATVDNESTFTLKEKPLLKIGAANFVTYPDLVNNLGWFFIASAVLLSFFSLLTLWEHHLYKQARFHVTEKVLKRRGFIN